ncbi:MAG: hypothetical protein QW814_03200 [Methanothrix sp.]
MIKNLAFDDMAIDSGLKKIEDIILSDGISQLSGSEQKIIGILKGVSEVLDVVFMKQICPDILEIIGILEKEKSAVNEKRLRYIKFAKGPFDPLNGLKPFVTWDGMRNDIALYPEAITNEEIEEEVKKGILKADDVTSYYTLVLRDGGHLRVEKYSDFYREDLEKAAKLLISAAKESKDVSLKSYLDETAHAFLTNNYEKQQILWLGLDGNIEPTIGPYETYEDKKFGYKGFFESYICVKNAEETKKLELYAKYLPEIDLSLPISGDLNFERKNQSNSPIVVVDEIMFGGEANAGFVTSAFNLPNDESVRSIHGSKKVLMKNIIRFKFKFLSNPIAKRLLDESQIGLLDENAAFSFVLFHELSHGLGASEAVKEGQKIKVPVALKELFSHIEEARADITGLYCAEYFHKKGILKVRSMDSFYVSYLATNILRGMRMGLKEAHAMGQAIEYNYIKEHGGIFYDSKKGRFGIDFGKIKSAVTSLCKELNEIEAGGSYEKAKEITEKYCHLPEEVKKAYEEISDIPIEIFPFKSEE